MEIERRKEEERMGIPEGACDVLGVNIKSGRVRVMERGLDRDNAEAYVTMAVYRRGVDEEFFAPVPAGSHADGDSYRVETLDTEPQ